MKNEKIMETLMVQANSGMYRVHDTYFEACKQKLQKQDSKISSEWDSFDSMALWPKLSPTAAAAAGAAPAVGEDVFLEETASIDEESEWSLYIPS